jgi:Domain of unknown function (DUF4188)
MADDKDPRSTESSDEDVVVFLIGARVNRWRDVRGWWPVLGAMPPMLRELARHPELGMLEARSYVSGRVVLVVQYWTSFEHLEAYARAGQGQHLPAWRNFNRRTRGGAVGIFHETFVVPAANRESIYVQMPAFGLQRALGASALSRGLTARSRLAPSSA